MLCSPTAIFPYSVHLLLFHPILFQPIGWCFFSSQQSLKHRLIARVLDGFTVLATRFESPKISFLELRCTYRMLFKIVTFNSSLLRISSCGLSFLGIEIKR